MFHPQRSQAAKRKQHLLAEVLVLLQEQLCSPVVHARAAFVRPKIQQNRASMRTVTSRNFFCFIQSTDTWAMPSILCTFSSEHSPTALLQQTQLTRCLSVPIPTGSPFLVLPRSLLWFYGIRVCNPVMTNSYPKIRVLRSSEQHNTPTGDPATFKIVSCSLIQSARSIQEFNNKNGGS